MFEEHQTMRSELSFSFLCLFDFMIQPWAEEVVGITWWSTNNVLLTHSNIYVAVGLDVVVIECLII